MHKRGISRFSVEIFLSQGTEKIRKGTLVFQKNSVWKIFMHKSGGGITIFRRNN